MRFIITIVAVLMILGLAAFGVVSAQKMSAAPSQATASDSPAALASQGRAPTGRAGDPDDPRGRTEPPPQGRRSPHRRPPLFRPATNPAVWAWRALSKSTR